MAQSANALNVERGYLTGLVREFADSAHVETKSELESSLISDLIGSFEANPVMARRAMRELMVRVPSRFYAAALQVLKDNGTTPGHDFLVSLLLENELLLMALVDPEAFPAKTAAGLAASLYRLDPQLDAKILRQAMKDDPGRSATARLAHALEILDEISDCSRLVPFLMKLSKHEEKRIRSKAILLLVRTHRNPDWFQQLMSVDDPRFRSNAIEGILYSKPGEKELHLLWAAAADAHHRVATTALRVLYHFGQLDAGDQLIELSRHPSEFFRAGAAWAMGETGDVRFLEVVQGMARSDSGLPRRASLKAAVKLRTPREPVESLPSGTI